MKKATVVILFLLLIACSVSAESDIGKKDASLQLGIDLFVSTWSADGAMADIECIDDQFRVKIEAFDCGYESSVWVYTCTYNAEEQTLHAAGGGVKTVYLYDEDLDTETEEVIYLDGSAVFALNAEGRLQWRDEKENTDHDVQLTKMGGFQGVWRCDDVTIEFSANGDIYRCIVTQAESPDAVTEWSYFCHYDPLTGQAVCDSGGRMEVLTVPDEWEPDYETVYKDGTAVFFIAEGKLIWHDAKDDAGKGLLFVKDKSEESMAF